MDQYDILFKGEVMPTLDPEQVAADLARLFKASPEKIAPLFNGGAHTLKSGLDRDAAERYRDTLKKAGAIVYLRRQGVPAREASSTRAANNSNGDLSVAPMVGNLVRDEEREAIVPVEVDTSALTLAADTDSPLQAPAQSTVEAPDTAHISVAEAGADLNPDRPEPIPVAAPDTDDLSLAPADIERLVDPQPEPDHPLPDIAAMALEPEGEILKDHERPAPPAPPQLTHDFDLADPE